MSKFNENYLITMKDIVQEGNPILREKIKEVPLPLSKDTKDELLSMMQFLKNSQNEDVAKKYKLRAGVGLSGNQIGLNKRMFVVYFHDDNGELFEHCLINPKIISHSTRQTHLPNGEGCLSVEEDIEGIVPRYEKIKIKALNEKEEEIILTLKHFPAIVFQHEIDHLNGVMFYDHIDKERDIKNLLF